MDELRRSEERFRATFEQAAVGVVHVTLDGRYERVNERFCDLVGYPRDELERMTFREITHAEDVAREQHFIYALVGGLGTSYTFEKRYRRKDGGSCGRRSPSRWCTTAPDRPTTSSPSCRT